MSRGDLLLLVAVLAAFGVVNSLYLTYQWYDAASSTWCDVSSYFSCTKVRESPYAAIGGIPTATVGIVGFAILLALSVFGLRGRPTLGPWLTDHWLVGFAAVGVGVGTGLTLIEILVIQAICILCIVAFMLGLGIFAAALNLARRSGG